MSHSSGVSDDTSENMTKTVDDIKKIIKEPRNYGERGTRTKEIFFDTLLTPFGVNKVLTRCKQACKKIYKQLKNS